MSTGAMNVLGGPLELCCTDSLTGFYRDGSCNTGSGDAGVHVVCAEMTGRFLAFSKTTGNDLSTSVPEFDFEGLKPGDRWCLCVLRWNEAYDAGKPPRSFWPPRMLWRLNLLPWKHCRNTRRIWSG